MTTFTYRLKLFYTALHYELYLCNGLIWILTLLRAINILIRRHYYETCALLRNTASTLRVGILLFDIIIKDRTILFCAPYTGTNDHQIAICNFRFVSK